MESWVTTHIRQDYEVSNLGNVRRVKRSPERYGKYSYQKPQHRRYSEVTIGGKRMLLHRLVAINHLPNPENKPYVCHKDNDTSNNNVDNLYWGTASENTKQAHNDGLIKVTTPFVKYIKCPHCNKEGNVPNMKRWHFNNCKEK